MKLIPGKAAVGVLLQAIFCWGGLYADTNPSPPATAQAENLLINGSMEYWQETGLTPQGWGLWTRPEGVRLNLLPKGNRKIVCPNIYMITVAQ